MQMAADLFRRATELDQNFARAWASLALAHSWLRTRGQTDVSFKDIEAFIATAMQLDANLAEAHVARAELLLRHLDIAAAEGVARRAIELDPTMHDAHCALAETLRRSGRLEEAARVYEVAVPLDDQAWWSAEEGSWCYEQIGDLDSARRLGREAFRRIEQAISFDPQNAKAYCIGGDILRILGQHDKALEWVRRSLEIDPNDHLIQFNSAGIFIRMGDVEFALDLLERGMPQLGRAQLDWMRRDPDFDKVRDHPRYLALVQREEERWRIASD